MSTPEKKTSYKEGLRMVESGILSQEQLESMIFEGIVASASSSRGIGRNVMIGSDGKTQIEPTLYFKGGNGLTYTKEMNELREKFNTIKDKYCVRTTEISKA